MQTLIALLGATAVFIIFRIISAILDTRRATAEGRRRGCQDPPRAPNRLPFGIDILQRLLRADREQQFPPMIIERFQEMGATTFMDSVLSFRYVIFTCEPKNIQALLATQFQDFGLGPRRQAALGPLLGHGIFTSDGKAWERSRAMLRPQFAREQVSDLQLEEQHVQSMMQALPVGEDGWTEQTDLLVLFFRLTIDSATEFLFGKSINSQLESLPGHTRPESLEDKKASALDEATFANAFDLSQRWLARRGRFRDLYWMITSKEFRTACKQVHEFVDHFVRLALDKKPSDKQQQGGKERYVFLEALVAETRDPKELRDQLLNILLAGRDTTASHLGWLFYLLARHPAIFEKLRATIIEQFGTYDNPRNLTFSGLKSCQYLQNVNNETLRLFPVVPVNGRQAVRDTAIPTGGGPDGKSPVFVRQGTSVFYSVHVMHRRKDLWGEDADEFKPERWNEGLKPAWMYLPFNGGPRICIGQQFALTEASYVIVRLLQRFDKIENCEPETRVRHNQTLINCSGNGVKVRLHEARH
ncbi:MAG: hypothetical protein M1823_006090 [Watsoniomyces obsoletus]|nr:MAG: hypothetical protein M1823_006090 [Watsoniomyces obsoletus]